MSKQQGDKKIPRVAEMELMRKRSSDATRKYRELRSDYIELESRFRAFIEAVDGIEPHRVTYKPSDKKQAAPVVAVGLWGDWHIGQTVRDSEIQNYNSFNLAIATRRMELWVQKFLDWVRVQRESYRIDTLHILGLGDFVHGLIHLENLIYEEFEPTVAVIKAAHLMANCLAPLAAECETLEMDMLETDNHGRLTAKTMFTGRAQWSFGHLLGEMVKQLVARIPNVRFRSHAVIKADVTIAGTNFLIEHGNDVRGWMGIPHYGLERLRSREIERRSAAFLPRIDWLVVGHFHTYSVRRGLLMNASLCGTTPYDHAAARYSPPGQLGFLVDPRYGPFNFVPFELGGNRAKAAAA